MRTPFLLPIVFGIAFSVRIIYDIEEGKDIDDLIAILQKWQRMEPQKWNTSEPIQFYIDPKAYEEWCIQGVNFWQENTCLSFKREYSSLEGNGIHFTNDDESCHSSMVGRFGFPMPQQISIGKKCWIWGAITHEIGHALGLIHEHSRFDRDDYISIEYENIRSENHFSFIKTQKSDFERSTAYDYGSVMHYGQLLANGIPTIRTLDENYQRTIGQQQKPSFNDVKKINLAYCSEICPKSVNCLNGGYVNPKNCTMCICPEGFEGAVCESVAKNEESCGENNLTANNNFQTLRIKGGMKCTYLITAPAGNNVYFEMTEFHFAKHNICNTEYVEINYGIDFSLTGARFCNELPTVFISKTNQLLVIYCGRSDANGETKLTLTFRQNSSNFFESKTEVLKTNHKELYKEHLEEGQN